MSQVSRSFHRYHNATIRLAQRKDAQQIIEVQLESLAILTKKDYQPHQIKALLNSKRRRRQKLETIFVAEIAGKIVGFAALDRSTSSIAGLFVVSDYARQGIGTQLLQTIEQEAKNNRIPILWVCASLTGYPFYLVNNYQELGKTEIYLEGVAIPCIQMKKRLLTLTKQQQIVKLLQETAASLLILWLFVVVLEQF